MKIPAEYANFSCNGDLLFHTPRYYNWYYLPAVLAKVNERCDALNAYLAMNGEIEEYLENKMNGDIVKVIGSFACSSGTLKGVTYRFKVSDTLNAYIRRSLNGSMKGETYQIIENI